MYEEHGAVHHMDVRSGTWLYRVFMLANSLQVDLAFAPQGDFAAKAPTFQLLFGTAPERPSTPPSAEQLIGWAWLYALHVRSALARGKLWSRPSTWSAQHVTRSSPRRAGATVCRPPRVAGWISSPTR